LKHKEETYLEIVKYSDILKSSSYPADQYISAFPTFIPSEHLENYEIAKLALDNFYFYNFSDSQLEKINIDATLAFFSRVNEFTLVRDLEKFNSVIFDMEHIDFSILTIKQAFFKFPNLKTVKGNLDLETVKEIFLPRLESIEGFLDITNTDDCFLPNLKSVEVIYFSSFVEFPNLEEVKEFSFSSRMPNIGRVEKNEKRVRREYAKYFRLTKRKHLAKLICEEE